MDKSISESYLYNKIIDERNIFAAIYSMESYVFERGLLNTTDPVLLNNKIVAKNDLELYYALADKHNVDLIGDVINICKKKLEKIFSDTDELFPITVYFRLKNYDDKKLKFRPLHTARLTDIICMVSILNCLMFEDDFDNGERHLSDLSKLVPHNFYGNIPSTDVQYLFQKWQTKYKEYTDNVIEHCKAYRKNHEYLTEVCLDIRNFYPSVSPIILYHYIVEKLSPAYSDDISTLKMAVAKLLFFTISEENIKPWLSYYYPDNFQPDDSNVYMNCGIPQGLPQSYFFGNLCMVRIKDILMNEKYFKGDAYFYVDDSVIYIHPKLTPKDFEEKIRCINQDLAEWNNNAQTDGAIEGCLSSRYGTFQAQIEYTIQFHEEGKSVFTPIDDAYTQNDLLLYSNRQTSMSAFIWNMDDIDNQVSLKKLEALNKVITGQIQSLKKKKEKLVNSNNAVSSQRKNLIRIKKYFLYRQRLMAIRNQGGPEKNTKKFIKRFLNENTGLQDWFDLNDEEIFMSEYRMLIQKEDLRKAQDLCKTISTFEQNCLSKGNVNTDGKLLFLYYRKDAANNVMIKSIQSDVYGALSLWVKMNLSGYKLTYENKGIQLFRRMMTNKEVITRGMITYQYAGKAFTKFVLKASKEFQRRILNAFFSEIIGVPLSDSLTFTKSNGRKINYAELRILAFLRNRYFDLQNFSTFVKSIDEKDISNRMAVDLRLLEVLGVFVDYVRKPEWIDSLILTHRITKSLWSNGSKFLYAYTLHNEEHAVTLIQKSVELVNRIDYFSLKRNDYYILFLACYLHDISMVIHPDLETFCSDKGENKILISNLIERAHEELETFYKIVAKPDSYLQIHNFGQFFITIFKEVYEYFENRIRSSHAKDSATFIKERENVLYYLEPTLRSFVAAVSESHCFDVEDVYGLKSKAKDETISLKYMMILIRLADLLDVANDRVNYDLLCQNMKHLSLTSQFHWISHLVTDKIELKTAYKVNNDEVDADSPKQPILETINLNLYLNFKQLTTIDNHVKCPSCHCDRKKNCMCISIKSGNKPIEECKIKEKCTMLCYWMMKKHEWLVKELIALNDYLYSVNSPLIKTQIKFNIYYRDDVKLGSDMFDAIQEYLINTLSR